MKTFIAAILLSVSTISLADDFSDTQIVKEIAWQAVNIIDYGQTLSIAKECKTTDRFEYNPALGLCPEESEVKRYFLASALLHYGISSYLDKQRDTWQNVTLIVSAGIVYHNYSIGLRVDF